MLMCKNLKHLGFGSNLESAPPRPLWSVDGVKGDVGTCICTRTQTPRHSPREMFLSR